MQTLLRVKQVRRLVCRPLVTGKADGGETPRQAQNSATGQHYRYSNGPVWVEYLQGLLAKKTGGQVALLDYAYGGATTNNSQSRLDRMEVLLTDTD